MKYHQFAPDPDTLAARIAGARPGGDVAAPGDAGRPDGAGRRTGPPVELPTTLDALTALRDRAFVEAAYRVVLGRGPDDAGGGEFVQALRAGVLDKVDILGDLRYSTEGRERAVEIPGLDWRYRLRRLGRLPIVGRIVRWAETLLRLPALIRVAQRHQAAIELASLEAEEHVAAIQRMQSEVRGMAARLGTAEGMLSEMFGDTRELLSRAELDETELRALRDDLRSVQQSFDARHKRLSAATEQLSRLVDGAGLPGGAPEPPPRVTGERPSMVPDGTAPDLDRQIAPRDFDGFYIEFEDRFRGSRDDVKRLQEVYLDYVRMAGAGTSASPILDVGCGRGEWLELLRERSYVGRGVDRNRVMIAGNRERGLDVVDSDALAYLASLPDDSVGMVTGFHVIEHLPFEGLVRLFDECRRVLRAGGCAVFETPNPENLVVGSYTFHFDPTHRHPLPPQMTEFLAWQRGFAEVEIVRLHPRPEPGSDQVLLDRWFRSPTDYAVVAWKDRKGPTAG
jgi:O-antigen chain-terminating methyltransferase